MDHEALWNAVSSALRKDLHNEAMVAAAAAAPPHALSPWALWMLIGVARHLRRQDRVRWIMREQLGVDLDEAGRSGQVELPAHVSPKGQLKHWGTYRFVDRGIRFRDQGTHETIEIDLAEGDTGHVDLQLFSAYLNEGARRTGSEVRLWELHISCETLGYAFDELVELGLLALRPAASRLACLSAGAAAHHDALVQVGYEFPYRRSGFERRDTLIRAAVLGDWLAADDCAQREDARMPWARAYTRPRAAQQRAERRDRLLAQRRASRDGLEIRALVELDAPSAVPYVRETLAGPQDLRCVETMRTIRYREVGGFCDNPDYGADVLALFRRIDLQGMEREYALWPLCAGFLLDRGLATDEVLATFASLGDVLIPGAALLAFQYAPDLAVPLLRRALLASHLVARHFAVAILVLLDEPWCAAMLIEALDTSADGGWLEWRAGLALLKDSCEAARAWEAAHPPSEDDRHYLELYESFIRERMSEWHDEVQPIRAQRARAAKVQNVA